MELTYEEWVAKYGEPEDYEKHYFKTPAKERGNIDIHNVWTETDDGQTRAIEPGWHGVNHVCNYWTPKAWDDWDNFDTVIISYKP